MDRDGDTASVTRSIPTPKSPARIKPCTKHINLTTEPSRNLVVCIDGTSNRFGPKNTSVVELYHLLHKNDKQVTYYNSGIGTYARPSWRSFTYLKQVVENKIDLAIAWNLERIVIDAYRWLSERYKEGDRIFLFGFSRGAYQVRALSAMIEKVGLIQEGNQGQIPFAYELYSDSIVRKRPLGMSKETYEEKVKEYEKSMAQFKQAFSRPVNIHFVGAWDTVSSVGIVRSPTLPGTTDGMDHVCHFRHALALDECRVKFLPEYAHGGVTSLAKDQMGSSTEASDIKEVWFAGSHSDIGGGHTNNTDMNRSGPPLMWMLSEAVACGLRVNTNTSQSWSWEGSKTQHESLSTGWWLLELLPVKRLTYKDQQDPAKTTHRAHLGRGRRVQAGQFIHGSVPVESTRPRNQSLSGPTEGLDSYVPRALLPGKVAWERTSADLSSHNIGLEKDLYQQAREFSGRLEGWALEPSLGDADAEVLCAELDKLTQTDVDRWALGVMPNISTSILEIISKMGGQNERTDVLVQLFKAVNSIAEVIPPRPGDSGRYSVQLLGPSLKNLLDGEKTSVEVAVGFMEKFIRKLAIEPDSLKIIENLLHINVEYGILKGILDGMLDGLPKPLAIGDFFMKNLQHRHIGHLCETGKYALMYNKDYIRFLAISPDGQHIASAIQADIQVWNFGSESNSRALAGHTARVLDVAISSDGQSIASCSNDSTIQIWSLAKEASDKSISNASAITLCFTPNGKLLSGSSRGLIEIWDRYTGQSKGRLDAHKDKITSLAVSPSGKFFASGSHDFTIRIWDLDTRECTRTWNEHTDRVSCVVFTPDNLHVISGSWDRTVRIWNTADGMVRLLGEHGGAVNSVAVSPNGKLAASGSYDLTIRIWDVDTGKAVGSPLQEHQDVVWDVKFTPDGQYVISCSEDGTIRRWKLSLFGVDTTKLGPGSVQT